MPKAARAFVHIMRPNKSKPPGGIKRTRKKIKKARRGVSTFKKRKLRTTVIGIGKAEIGLAKTAGKGVVRAAGSLPPRTRHKTVVIRTAGGRFAGSRRV